MWHPGFLIGVILVAACWATSIQGLPTESTHEEAIPLVSDHADSHLAQEFDFLTGNPDDPNALRSNSTDSGGDPDFAGMELSFIEATEDEEENQPEDADENEEGRQEDLTEEEEADEELAALEYDGNVTETAIVDGVEVSLLDEEVIIPEMFVILESQQDELDINKTSTSTVDDEDALPGEVDIKTVLKELDGGDTQTRRARGVVYGSTDVTGNPSWEEVFSIEQFRYSRSPIVIHAEGDDDAGSDYEQDLDRETRSPRRYYSEEYEDDEESSYEASNEKKADYDRRDIPTTGYATYSYAMFPANKKNEKAKTKATKEVKTTTKTTEKVTYRIKEKLKTKGSSTYDDSGKYSTKPSTKVIYGANPKQIVKISSTSSYQRGPTTEKITKYQPVKTVYKTTTSYEKGSQYQSGSSSGSSYLPSQTYAAASYNDQCRSVGLPTQPKCKGEYSHCAWLRVREAQCTSLGDKKCVLNSVCTNVKKLYCKGGCKQDEVCIIDLNDGQVNCEDTKCTARTRCIKKRGYAASSYASSGSYGPAGYKSTGCAGHNSVIRETLPCSRTNGYCGLIWTSGPCNHYGETSCYLDAICVTAPKGKEVKCLDKNCYKGNNYCVVNGLNWKCEEYGDKCVAYTQCIKKQEGYAVGYETKTEYPAGTKKIKVKTEYVTKEVKKTEYKVTYTTVTTYVPSRTCASTGATNCVTEVKVLKCEKNRLKIQLTLLKVFSGLLWVEDTYGKKCVLHRAAAYGKDSSYGKGGSYGSSSSVTVDLPNSKCSSGYGKVNYESTAAKIYVGFHQTKADRDDVWFKVKCYYGKATEQIVMYFVTPLKKEVSGAGSYELATYKPTKGSCANGLGSSCITQVEAPKCDTYGKVQLRLTFKEQFRGKITISSGYKQCTVYKAKASYDKYSNVAVLDVPSECLGKGGYKLDLLVLINFDQRKATPGDAKFRVVKCPEKGYGYTLEVVVELIKTITVYKTVYSTEETEYDGSSEGYESKDEYETYDAKIEPAYAGPAYKTKSTYKKPQKEYAPVDEYETPDDVYDGGDDTSDYGDAYGSDESYSTTTYKDPSYKSPPKKQKTPYPPKKSYPSPAPAYAKQPASSYKPPKKDKKPYQTKDYYPEPAYAKKPKERYPAPPGGYKDPYDDKYDDKYPTDDNQYDNDGYDKDPSYKTDPEYSSGPGYDGYDKDPSYKADPEYSSGPGYDGYDKDPSYKTDPEYSSGPGYDGYDKDPSYKTDPEYSSGQGYDDKYVPDEYPAGEDSYDKQESKYPTSGYKDSDGGYKDPYGEDKDPYDEDKDPYSQDQYPTGQYEDSYKNQGGPPPDYGYGPKQEKTYPSNKKLTKCTVKYGQGPSTYCSKDQVCTAVLEKGNKCYGADPKHCKFVARCVSKKQALACKGSYGKPVCNEKKYELCYLVETRSCASYGQSYKTCDVKAACIKYSSSSTAYKKQDMNNYPPQNTKPSYAVKGTSYADGDNNGYEVLDTANLQYPVPKDITRYNRFYRKCQPLNVKEAVLCLIGEKCVRVVAKTDPCLYDSHVAKCTQYVAACKTSSTDPCAKVKCPYSKCNAVEDKLCAQYCTIGAVNKIFKLGCPPQPFCMPPPKTKAKCPDKDYYEPEVYEAKFSPSTKGSSYGGSDDAGGDYAGDYDSGSSSSNNYDYEAGSGDDYAPKKGRKMYPGQGRADENLDDSPLGGTGTSTTGDVTTTQTPPDGGRSETGQLDENLPSEDQTNTDKDDVKQVEPITSTNTIEDTEED